MVGLSKQALGPTLAALGGRSTSDTPHTANIPLRGFGNYNENAAPTVCAATEVGYTDHGAMHSVTERAKRRFANAPVLDDFGVDMNGNRIESRWTYNDASNAGAEAHHAVHPHCSKKCTKAQLDAYHTGVAGIEAEDEVRTDLSQSYPQGAQWLRDNR